MVINRVRPLSVGKIAAFIYNIVSRIVGGIEVDVS